MRRMPAAFLFKLFLLFRFSITLAAFTHNQCYKLKCVEQRRGGAWCFQPGNNLQVVDPKDCTNTVLKSTLGVHLAVSSVAIAYYDVADLSLIDGATWSVPTSTRNGSIALCMSGKLDDTRQKNGYRSTCRFSRANDDQNITSAHRDECSLEGAPSQVSDGCYPALANFVWWDHPTSKLVVLLLGGISAAVTIIAGVYKGYQWVKKKHRGRVASHDRDTPRTQIKDIMRTLTTKFGARWNRTW